MIPVGEKPERQPRLSLRLKLTLWIVVISTIVQVTLTVIAILYLRVTLAEFFNLRLHGRAVIMVEAVRQADCRVTDEDLHRIASDTPRFVVVEKVALTLYEPNGDVIASNLRPAPSAEEVGVLDTQPAGNPRTVRVHVPGLRSDGGDYPARMRLYPVRSGSGRSCVLLVAATDSTFQSMMRVATQIVLITLPAGAIATGIAGWMIGGLAIAPLARLRRITVSLAPDTLRDVNIEKGGEFREVAELERSLEATREKLKIAFQAQDRFIANVSHELKTPIAVVLAEADTLPQSELSPRARAFVESTVDEMRKLGTIVQSFLTLTKLKSGAALTRLHPADVNAIVLEAVLDCRKQAQQHRVEVIPELAESDRALEVVGNAEQLQVMVVNLIRNAIRFSPEGRQVIVRVIDMETECAVTVRDFGRGVPAEIIDRLFDRFVQGPTEAGRGHGLGLAIAQGIAELHAGKISVRNIAEGGCEFSVRLPLNAPAPETGRPGA